VSQPPLPPPHARLMALATGHWAAAATHAATRAGLCDAIGTGSRVADEVAADCGTHPQATFRILRALASLGVCRETEAGSFALTEMGALLRKDHPASLRGLAMFQSHPAHWLGWGSFEHSLRTGEPAFEHVHGEPFFDFCQKTPDLFEPFNDAMTGLSQAVSAAVADAYDFGGIERLVDVGGGHGLLLERIVAKHPDVHGVVFDLPAVIEGARTRLAQLGLTGRIEAVGGDFFAELPPGDAFVAKHIIHDWGDDDCVKILTAARRALTSDAGRVLLVEMVVPPGDDPHPAKLLDLEMLQVTHFGRERTETEFRELFTRAGLELKRVVPTREPHSILEARVA